MQLTATGALPALDGSNVSNVNAASLQGYAASYFTDRQQPEFRYPGRCPLVVNVPLKNTNNTFTGSNTFAGVAATSAECRNPYCKMATPSVICLATAPAWVERNYRAAARLASYQSLPARAVLRTVWSARPVPLRNGMPAPGGPPRCRALARA